MYVYVAIVSKSLSLFRGSKDSLAVGIRSTAVIVAAASSNSSRILDLFCIRINMPEHRARGKITKISERPSLSFTNFDDSSIPTSVSLPVETITSGLSSPVKKSLRKAKRFPIVSKRLRGTNVVHYFRTIANTVRQPKMTIKAKPVPP